MFNSLIMAVGITVGKLVVSIPSAYAVVFFRFRGRMLAFWAIFVTLLLPVQVRFFPTYSVTADLGMLNSFQGLIIPLIASATATFLFRQFFLTMPRELSDAARMDGAGPMTFLWKILLPLSRPNLAAIAVIEFIYGWNQYLWPLLASSGTAHKTVVVGMQGMISAAREFAVPEWNIVMAAALLAMAPPVIVMLIMQRWFIKGITGGIN
jgi:sn-glycerol 3-phosphate transport system permease protein